MKTATKTKGGKGLLVQPDDLQVGEYYAVHGIKNDPAEAHPIFGQAFRLKAVNLPFVVGTLVSDPEHPALTFDVRYLNLMRVTPDFVKAQAPSHGPDPD
jgi:hypothetical protein